MAIRVLVLAAGKGTRMRSHLPKVMHKVAGIPMLERVLGAARGLGPERLAVVVSDMVDLFEHTFGGNQPPIEWVLQAERLGTGHAVLQGRTAMERGGDADLLILCGDMPRLRTETLERFLVRWRESGADAVIASTKVPDPTGYGRILRDAGGQFRGIVEERDAQPEQRVIREINTGIYAARTHELMEALTKVGNSNDQGEYYLPDAFTVLLKQGARVEAIELAPADEFEGVNDRVQLSAASTWVFGQKAGDLMRRGVSILDPRSTYIEDGVQIGMDTLVEPGAILAGNTRIGESCRIGAYSVLRDTVVGDDVEILEFCHLEGAELGRSTRVGPYARLREGTRLGERARIGNFVETKKTDLGPGAKANHLAYLGDATVGAGANIGAGTITCNYDGVRKHPTEIGAGVFVGSNATLVAPLALGDGAFVAAGSVVTRSAREDALVLGRARQETKDGYAKLLRERLRGEGAGDEPGGGS